MPGAHFQAPLVVDNKEGWGPTDDTFQYKDMPYQPYSKSDQLGKVKRTSFLSKIFDLICFYFRSPIGRALFTEWINERIVEEKKNTILNEKILKIFFSFRR